MDRKTAKLDLNHEKRDHVGTLTRLPSMQKIKETRK